jgi:hypothetical protein
MDDDREEWEGRLMACEALLILLVARMNRANPDFEEKAKEAFDTIMGKRVARGEVREEHEIVARRLFMEMIESVPPPEGVTGREGHAPVRQSLSPQVPWWKRLWTRGRSE